MRLTAKSRLTDNLKRPTHSNIHTHPNAIRYFDSKANNPKTNGPDRMVTKSPFRTPTPMIALGMTTEINISPSKSSPFDTKDSLDMDLLFLDLYPYSEGELPYTFSSVHH